MKLTLNINKILQYFLIIALYYVTGGAFSYTNYSLQITLLFFVSFILCIFFQKKNFLKKTPFFVWVYMCIFLLFVPIIFNDSIPTYVAIMLQLAIGAFCASFIPVEEFIKIYINVIVIFALISLIGYTLSLIRPSIALLFPVTIGDASVDYYNAGVYVFMSAKGFGELSITTRNAGICWEPGCYQCFLNIGLFFLLERKDLFEKKYYYLKISILVITILTTISTTGILIMAILLLIYYKKWIISLNFKSYLIIFALIGVVIFMFNYTNLGDFFQNKISREFGNEGTFLERISLSKIQYIVSENGIPYFFGMSFSKWITFDESMWNSIIHSLLCLGFPFTTIQLIGYWRGCHVLSKKWWVLFFIMILCASTETLFWRVFFNTFAFYGWIYYKNRKGCVNEKCSFDNCP